MISKIAFNPKILSKYFDDAVLEECRSCKRYGFKKSCPPFIPDISYFKKLLPAYDNGLVIYKKFKIMEIDEWSELGKSSSLEIHQYLLKQRNSLIQKGYIFNLALIAGSCKLCNTCSTPCRYPDKSLMPIEGTGINVIEFMKNFRVDVKFPVEKQKFFYRIGILLWK